MKQFYAYIMSNHSQTLYVGVTNNLERRVYQHKIKLLSGFTSQYNLTKLAYYGCFRNIKDANAREKQIKGWARTKKLALIEVVNPGWHDLSSG